MPFDGEALVREFLRVWEEHDLEGIVAMFADDIVYEASFGEKPWGMPCPTLLASVRLQRRRETSLIT